MNIRGILVKGRAAFVLALVSLSVGCVDRGNSVALSGEKGEAITAPIVDGKLYWKNVTPATGPAPRDQFGLVALTQGEFLMFGGISNGVPLGDTWKWSNGAWTSLSRVSTDPSPRSAVAMASLGNGQVLLFGGKGPRVADYSNDSYRWTSTTGWQQQPSSGIGARSGAFFSCFSASDCLLYGGKTPSGEDHATWRWNGTAWADVSGGLQPPTATRRGALAALGAGDYLLFGGMSGNTSSSAVTYNETWEWRGGSWNQYLVGASGFAPGAQVDMGLVSFGSGTLLGYTGGPIVQGKISPQDDGAVQIETPSDLLEWVGGVWSRPRLASGSPTPGDLRYSRMVSTDTKELYLVGNDGTVWTLAELIPVTVGSDPAYPRDSLSCNPAAVMDPGTTRCVLSIPDPGVEIRSFTCTGLAPASCPTPAGAAKGWIDVPVTGPGPVTITPVFGPETHIVTVRNPSDVGASTDNALKGSVTCLPVSPVAYDTTLTCTVHKGSNSDYALSAVNCSGLSVCPQPKPTDTGFTIAHIQSDVTLTPVFTLPTEFPIAVTPSVGGTIVCAPNPVRDGGATTCTAAPSTGYTLAAPGCDATLTGCPKSGDPTSPFTLTHVQGPVTLMPVFQPEQHQIAVQSDPAKGTIDCGGAAIDYNASAPCQVHAEPGYTLSGLACAPSNSNLCKTSPGAMCPSSGFATLETFNLGYVTCDVTLIPTFSRISEACQKDIECDIGEYCAAGTCVPKKLIPQPCSDASGRECLSGLCGGSPITCQCPEDRHDDGTGHCVAVLLCAPGQHDAGNGQCVESTDCSPGFGSTLNSMFPICRPTHPCPAGSRFDGATCLSPDHPCATGFHDGGDGTCVADGQGCSAGYEAMGTPPVCILALRCSLGFHNDGTGHCVADVACADGYQSNGVGTCVPTRAPQSPACASGFHDGGSGDCVPDGQCQERYHLVAGTNDCVVDLLCASGKRDNGAGECQSIATPCVAGTHEGGSGDCIGNVEPSGDLCQTARDCPLGSRCLAGVCQAPPSVIGGGGSGCSTGGTGLLWSGLLAVGLGLWGARRRRGAASVASLLGLGLVSLGMGAGTARAAEARFELQQFRPSLGQFDLLGIESARVARSLDWSVQGLGNYASLPLAFRQTDGSRLKLVSNQGTIDVGGALGLFDWGELSVALPVTTSLTPASEGSYLTSRLGMQNSIQLSSVRVTPKVRFLQAGALNLGISAPVEVPFGGGSFLQASRVSVNPRFLAEYSDGFRLAANVGAIFREKQPFLDLTTGNALTYGAGASVPLIQSAHQLDLIGTVQGEGFWQQKSINSKPLEGLAALRWTMPSNLALTVGGGAGLLRGYGAPEYRVLAGLSYASNTEARPVRSTTAVPSNPVWTRPLDISIAQGEKRVVPVMGQVDGGTPRYRLRNASALNGRAELMPDQTIRYTAAPQFVGRDRVTYQVEDTLGRVADGTVDVQVAPAPTPVPAKKELAQIKGSTIEILEPVYFATNKDQILTKSYPVLDSVRQLLVEHPEIKRIRIEGHTDSAGDAAKNLDLSKRRAVSVMTFLMNRGITADRLTSEGFGQNRPIADNKTADGRSLNRRVMFKIVSRAQ